VASWTTGWFDVGTMLFTANAFRFISFILSEETPPKEGSFQNNVW
jgi:hypothetical protein